MRITILIHSSWILTTILIHEFLPVEYDSSVDVAHSVAIDSRINVDDPLHFNQETSPTDS